MTKPFSIVVSAGAPATYLLDTHGTNSLYILSLTSFTKDMLAYGAIVFANGFIVSHGVELTFLILGACQGVCWLTTIPMYVYGNLKRAWSFMSTCPIVPKTRTLTEPNPHMRRSTCE